MPLHGTGVLKVNRAYYVIKNQNMFMHRRYEQ